MGSMSLPVSCRHAGDSRELSAPFSVHQGHQVKSKSTREEAPMKHLSRAAVAALPLLMVLPTLGAAQPMQPPSQAEAQAALNPAPAPFTDAQLDQMLAPIALYPDQLLV